jgi:hypothetical protein
MIDKPIDLNSLDQSNLPQLNEIISSICQRAASVKYTDVVPTAETVAEGEVVIYDNNAGTVGAYVITQKKHLFGINDGANLVNLGNIPAGAGVIPAANLTAQATSVFSILFYDTSFSSSTQQGTAGSTLKIAYGSTGTAVPGSGSQNVTNLPFTSGTSYVVLVGNYTAFNMAVSGKAAAQFTLTNTHSDAVGGNGNGDWLAFGI